MIICLILGIILIIVAVAIAINVFINEGCIDGIGTLFIGIVVVGLIDLVLVGPFVALDRSSGSTVGKITSVDKNFFGTTAIYIKVNETKEEKYCAENENVIEYAKENIGKYVKVSYGTRVGLYHLNQCRQAPIEKIEIYVEE